MPKNAVPFAPPPLFAPEPLGLRLRRWRPSTLQVAFMLSIALHGALLGLKFIDPQGFDRVFQDSPLEIVLVNARSREAPEKAQVIAQAQLAGGGEAAKALATSPLMAAPATQAGDAEDELQRQIDQQLEVQERELMRVKRELSALPMPEPDPGTPTPQQRAQQEHVKQMLRALAAIEKTIQMQNSRPRRRYVSPASREEVYAVWSDELRRRIEAKGTQDYPRMNGRPLRGSLIVNIVVNWHGQLLDARVMQSSGQVALDQRALAIVRAAGPFSPFTPAMRKKADELEWTWQFHFGQEGLKAQAFGGA